MCSNVCPGGHLPETIRLRKKELDVISLNMDMNGYEIPDEKSEAALRLRTRPRSAKNPGFPEIARLIRYCEPNVLGALCGLCELSFRRLCRTGLEIVFKSPLSPSNGHLAAASRVEMQCKDKLKVTSDLPDCFTCHKSATDGD